MFKSVLVANRGEIACRIIRTARRLGLRAIAVYSSADAAARHVMQADAAYLIGPADPARSYLDGGKIIEIANRAQVDCIHPGYGFLAENADFAEACGEAGIVFVGPSPEAIRAMGLKDAAKALMEKAGVPVVPGYYGRQQSVAKLKSSAADIGYPVLIKAVAGGGGKGMRKVERDSDFEAALEGCRREAKGAFGDDRVLIEKFIERPRHIEIQVFADSAGNCVHLFERDCSLQRRHQKVVEEAPAPGMPEAVRAAMGAAAVAAAKAVGYCGAGTVEFIVDGAEGLREDGFWFMEMNTRLQVEHPVSEMITQTDLVEWQFRVAAGAPLPVDQAALSIGGHAVEARLYAEDPDHDFLPSTGVLRHVELPDTGAGLRIDAGVAEGDDISPYYDPMIAKVIAHGADRDTALRKLGAALDEIVVLGVRTNAAFLRDLVRHPRFVAADFDTGLIDAELGNLTATGNPVIARALAAMIWLEHLGFCDLEADRRVTNEPLSPWDLRTGWSLGHNRTDRLHLLASGHPFTADLDWHEQGVRVEVAGDGVEGSVEVADFTCTDNSLTAVVDGVELNAPVAFADDAVYLLSERVHLAVSAADLLAREDQSVAAGGLIRSPMPGRVIEIFVRPGDRVETGDRLAIVEAMKMEHTLNARSPGEVAAVHANPGDQVEEGLVVLTIAPDSPPQA